MAKKNKINIIGCGLRLISQLDFVADGYFSNILLYRKWNKQESLALLRDLVDKTA